MFIQSSCSDGPNSKGIYLWYGNGNENKNIYKKKRKKIIYILEEWIEALCDIKFNHSLYTYISTNQIHLKPAEIENWIYW